MNYSADTKIEDDSHIEEIDGGKDLHITRSEYIEAQQDALAEARPPWEIIKENWKTFFVVVIVQTNGIILGLEYVLLGALVGVQAFCRVMGVYDASTGTYAVEAWTLSLWAGLFGLMQFAGQLFGGWYIDRFGRRAGIYTMILIVYLGVMTEILSQNRNDYTGAKIIMGVATGLMQVVIPTYVAEITPFEIRGITVGAFAFNLSLGSLIGTFVTYGADQAWGSDAFDNRGWRVPLYVGLAAPTITLVGMLCVVSESPYWLVLKNRIEDAKKSLKNLHPNKSEAEIERLAHEMQYTVAKERENKEMNNASYIECFQGANLRRTFCALFPSCSQQLVGNQLVQSYSTYFFTLAKLSNALLASVIVSIVGLAASVVAFFLIEMKTVGRWNLVFFGVMGITMSMLCIGIVDSADPGLNSSAGSALVAFVALFNAATALGPGVAGWSYAGESGSVRLRAKTATLATGANAIIGTLTTIVIPFELVAIGPKTGYMFFGLGVISLILIYVWIPDVTGRTYAQLDELFERRIPARKFKTTECTGDYGADVTGREV